MLKNITVTNFAIIDNLELDFSGGMTVLTGETGAGKSIIIDALQYALGARADSNMVRHNAKRADISVLFNIANIPNAIDWLKTQELEDENNCLLRRTINADGGSKQFINGQPCTQNQLRELAELLITIHGQHENQNLSKKTVQQQLLDDFANSLGLVNKKNQAKALDKFAAHGQLLQNVTVAYQQWLIIKHEIDNLQNNNHDYSARIELLTYQLNELEKLGLAENELKQLEAEHKKLSSADAISEDCSTVKTLLSDESDESIISLLQTSLNKLQKYQSLDIKIANSYTMINEALIQAQEADDELENYLNHIEINPERLQQVDSRLSEINDLARKHKIHPEKLPEKLLQLTQELHNLQHADKRLETLSEQLSVAEKNYLDTAKQLTASRKLAAKTFNQQVTYNIQQLGMPNGEFSVNFIARDQFNQSGAEGIEFLISANPGQPMKPINKIASGGELSRISLAIEVITAQNTNTPTLIFDEVDVGIGGGTAEIVGRLLRELGNKTQVLCITHLPQVAAQAHHHLQVRKLTNQKETQTEIIELLNEDKVKEIARMLGGVKITAQTLAHAEEMITSADA